MKRIAMLSLAMAAVVSCYAERDVGGGGGGGRR